jgi:hypothetical protein
MSSEFIVIGICTLGFVVYDLFFAVYLMRAYKNRTKSNLMKLLNLMPFGAASARRSSKEKLIKENPKGTLIITVIWFVITSTVVIIFCTLALPSVWNN